MKVSFIATVYNEESSVLPLLKSLLFQSKVPAEIIIVDGGSTDATTSVISRLRQDFGGQANFQFRVKKGNRSVGRNEAIRNANSEIIVCSDAGCILDKNWVKNIIEPFTDSKVDVVAGYYSGKPNSVFEKCLIPYVLVMPDQVNKNNFLPSARSMAFKKSIWKKAGGFPEKFRDNEDYVFAKKLKEINANIVFEKKAIVHWLPRSNIKNAFIMFYRFAKGDSESRIFRPKMGLVFLRYFIGFIFFGLFFITNLYYLLFTYFLWAIIKNYKYVKDIRAIFFLPLIQIISDIAIICGTIEGFISSYKLRLNERRQL